MSNERIAILGPGAVGGLLAARLSAHGADVTVLARAATAAAIAAGGLRARLGDGTRVTTRPHAVARLDGPVGLLLVAVKATELDAALERVDAAHVAGATVVPLLNGVDHMATLRAAFPRADVVAGAISVEATRTAPGAIEQHSPFCELAVATDGGRPGAEAAAARLAAAGFTVRTGDGERLVLWRKLALLAPFALTTTSASAPLGAARRAYPGRLEALAIESVAAAAASGAAVDPGHIQARLALFSDDARSSMLKDREAGRPLELAAIAGPILRALGDDDAPVTRAVVDELAPR